MAFVTIWKISDGTPLTIEGVDAKDLIRSGVYTATDPSTGTSSHVVEIDDAAYTLKADDAGEWLEFSEECEVTIPKNVFPVPTDVTIYQGGDDPVSVVAASGVTLNKFGSFNTVTRGRHAVVVLKQRRLNLWTAIGLLESA